MLILKDDTYFIKNWSKYQSADKLRKINNSNKVIQEDLIEKNLLLNTEDKEKIREENIKKENRGDESNFQTFD